MKVDITADGDPRTYAARAREAEADGYDGLWLGETAHDPLTGCALAGQATSRISVGTGIAVAFARSPMTLAVTANDLQLTTQGRFLLGLGPRSRRTSPGGSRCPGHARRRGCASSSWRCARSGGRGKTASHFTGEFYSHTLMTPFFDPGPNPYGPPRCSSPASGTP